MREAAWIVVHNNMLARYMTEEKMFKLIPRTKNPQRIKQWNSCVSVMYDIPQSVKDLYIIDENGDTKFAMYMENKDISKE